MMGRMAKEARAANIDIQSYNYWVTRMLQISSSAVEWLNLPDTCDTVLLENCLNRTGSAIMIFDDMVGGYFVGQNASVGNIDIYGYPQDRRIIFMNGQTMAYDVEESVICYNNSMRSADLWIIEWFARRMANIDGAVDVNINSQKTMPIIPTTQNQRLSIENLYKNIQNNIPYTLVDADSMNVEKLKEALTFDNRRSFTADLMTDVQREIWNRFLTYVGINNTNVEKKERINVPEINSNLEEVVAMRRNRLNARKRFCHLVNNLWGLNVDVRYYSEEVSGSGNVYGGNQSDLRGAIPTESSIDRPENTGRSAD